MNPFYDFFERNVSGLSTDIVRSIDRQVSELLDIFPQLNRSEINVELECRYKAGSTDKIVGPLLNDLDGRPGMVKRSLDITDINYNIERFRGKSFTVRDSKVGSVRSMYTKMKIFTPRSAVSQEFEDMGLKLSFALEITSDIFAETLLETSGNTNTPLKRVKNRESYIDVARELSFDITQVLTTNTGRRDTEIEVDSTIPFNEFMRGEPVGRVKNFISFCEEQARTTVFQTRALLQRRTLEEAISRVNRCLGSNSPNSYKIDQRVPQVRNIRVEDLLKEGYSGYGTTPKADGYRYFMVILPRIIVLLQPPNSYKVLYEGRDIPREWVGFVFDGEWIEKQNWRPENLSQTFMEGVDNYYCIFDVIGFPSSSTFPPEDQQSIIHRINRLKSFFEEVRRQTALGPFRWSKNFNGIHFQPHSSTRIQIPVLKTFMEIKPYEDALSTCWHAADAFAETLLPKLRYKDDGMIFTPVNRSYLDLNDHMSLKWKPEELLTIDFQFRDNKLLVRRDREEVPFRGTHLFPLEKIEIDNPDGIRLVNNRVYEFAYTPATERFQVIRPRFDKVFPNSIRTAFQVWNDCHRPVALNLVRGIGREGLVETQREALWTWLRNVLGKAQGPICDLTNLRPLEDIPLRFLENKEFETLFKRIPVYRLSPRQRIDFPDVHLLPTNPDDVPEFEFLILNGQQCMMLENRRGVTASNADFFTERYVALLRKMVSRSKNVFVRNLPCIVPGQTPSTFLPERSAYGPGEELVLQPVGEDVVRIQFELGGVFHDITTDSYDSLISTLAYERHFDSSCRIFPAGHRISDQMQDMGPDLILNGKHFGILWDYVYNALLPPSYFQPFVQSLFQKVLPDQDPLTDLMTGIGNLAVEETPTPATDEGRGFQFDIAFQTLRDEGSQPVPRELVRESTHNPGRGDVFDILSKAMMILDTTTPPLDQLSYDKDVVMKRAGELRLLFGALMRDPRELVRAVYERLRLGIVFVRRMRNTNALEAFHAQFFLPEEINASATNGFIIMESHPETMDLLTQCSLLTYRGKILIHPSDPLLEILFKSPLVSLDLVSEGSKLSPAKSGKVKIWNSSWPSLHRLFNSLRFLYPGAPDANREYIKEILNETTDNKADYLILMKVPPRFHKQVWAIQLMKTMETYLPNVRADPTFEDRAESEFGKLLESFTDKNRRELLATGDAFLYDNTYPNNLYGRGLMMFRNKLKGI